MRSSDGEAKYWLTPQVELATSHGLHQANLTRIKEIIEEHYDELVDAWKSHFGG